MPLLMMLGVMLGSFLGAFTVGLIVKRLEKGEK